MAPPARDGDASPRISIMAAEAAMHCGPCGKRISRVLQWVKVTLQRFSNATLHNVVLTAILNPRVVFYGSCY